MAPFFTVFCDKQATKDQTENVRVLERYYSVFIDSELDPIIIKSKYKSSNHKVFRKYLGEWLMYDVKLVESFKPAFVLTFDKDATTPASYWETALKFIKSVFSDSPDNELIDEMYKIVPKAPIAEKISVLPVKNVEKQNNEYMFSHWMDSAKDICICQIDKPFTDRPYTCVIEDFSNVDFVPMFTAFYICASWGVCPQDSMFLVHLWNHLDMKSRYGSIDLERRLRERIEACEKGEPEPRVYRDKIEQVKNLLNLQ